MPFVFKRNYHNHIFFRNEKIKAKIENYDQFCKMAEEMSGGPPEELYEDETFYKVELGRLKLRFDRLGHGRLVRYHREDQQVPNMDLVKQLATSQVLDFAPHDARILHENLLPNLGTLGRVIKKRKVYQVDRVIFCVDNVEHRGQFVKLELLRKPGETPKVGQAILRAFVAQLGIKDSDIYNCPYVEMLVNSSGSLTIYPLSQPSLRRIGNYY